MARPRKPQPQTLTVEMTEGALESALLASLQPLYAEIAELKTQLAASLEAQTASQQALTQVIMLLQKLDSRQTQHFQSLLDSLQLPYGTDASSGF